MYVMQPVKWQALRMGRMTEEHLHCLEGPESGPGERSRGKSQAKDYLEVVVALARTIRDGQRESDGWVREVVWSQG